MHRFSLKNNISGIPDLYLSGGSIARAIDNEAICQAIATKLRTFMGEYYLDQNYGIPYYQKLFTKPANLQFFDSIIKSNTLAVNGVNRISYYKGGLIPSTRIYDISMSVLDNDGNTLQLQLNL